MGKKVTLDPRHGTLDPRQKDRLKVKVSTVGKLAFKGYGHPATADTSRRQDSSKQLL